MAGMGWSQQQVYFFTSRPPLKPISLATDPDLIPASLYRSSPTCGFVCGRVPAHTFRSCTESHKQGEVGT